MSAANRNDKLGGVVHILLIGASGMIGSRVLEEAVARGHTVKSACRRPERIAPAPGVATLALDASVADAVAAAAEGVDAIVSATSPRSGGDPVAEAARVGDALIAAARRAGKRLLVVGGASSLESPDGADPIEKVAVPYRGEALGMREVLLKLTASDIAWTYFSPPWIIAPGERTGVFRLGTTTAITSGDGESRISAEDYAVALVDELEAPKHVRSQMTVGY